MLRVVSNALHQRGVTTPNVNKGSDDYQWASAVGNEVEAIGANLAVAADQLMPDSAVDDDLARLLAIYGLAFRPAGASVGNVIFNTTLTTAIGTGQQLQDPNGNRFAVTIGGTYANGASIPVASVGVGSPTNLAGGVALTWVTPPTYSAPTALLDAKGAYGGVDKEDNDTARRRLLQLLRSPPGSGNASMLAGAGDGADASVQKTFIYPACNGPGTQHAAVVGFATASYTRSRAVSATAVANATSAIQASAPETTELVVTGTVDQTADVSFMLQLPAATTAIPAGTGGGFVDSAPFPSVVGAATTRLYCLAVAVTNSTTLRVESMVAPIVGQTIAWVDRAYFALHTAKILAGFTTAIAPSGTTPGQYNITIDTPFADQAGNPIVASDYVFPAATNSQSYLSAVLASFAALGPGEKTLAGGHAYRLPRYFSAYDYTLGDQFLRALSNSGAEVQAASWGYQNGGVKTPALPATISTGPSILIPLRIAFYPQ